VELPIVQACHPGSERIYTVDGFVDASGELSAMLACVQLLQRPRKSGPGIIFDEAPVDAAVEEGLRKLCRSTGFYGVFDAEFLEHEGRKLLIDFNPRFYNHMAFEVDRGLPLPHLAYLAALGDLDALEAATAEARAARPERRVYVHRLSTELMLSAQVLAGSMHREERRRWRRWVTERDGAVTDPVGWGDDRGPALAAVALELAYFARHPRSYLRHLATAADGK
jgi:predicted ATP-grasp superfamily ATP-dependent carboligase